MQVGIFISASLSAVTYQRFSFDNENSSELIFCLVPLR
uniref:Uncharacterized protein n=1 Tax=Arundo donax TaxID=35708 RepID=A0A0A9GZP4_ARUDO